MTNNLTQGIIHRIYSQDPQANGVPATLQVLNVKTIASKQNQAPRQRIVISDGVCYTQAMLATQMNSLVAEGKMTEHCIIQIQNFVVSHVAQKKVVIILACTVMDPGPGQAIGDPQNVESYNSNNAPTPMNTDNNTPMKNENYGGGGGGVPAYMQNSSRGRSNDNDSNITPISALNPYQNRWTIKARVTAKGDIRTWSNQRGDGKLFSVDILDKQGGQIRATMFNESADKFFPMLEVDKVFTFTKGTLKLANKKYNTLPNEYELTLNADCEINAVDDDANIEKQKFEFETIDRISDIQPDENIDIIGVVTDVSSTQQLVSKKTQKELIKRTVKIIDDTLSSIDITFWGKMCEEYTEEMLGNNCIIAMKGVRVSDFGGRSINTTFTTQVFKDPEHDRAYKLRQWYDEKGGRDAQFKTLSVRGGGGGGGSDVRLTFQEMKEQNIGHGEKPDYFCNRGTTTFFKKDMEKPPWYNACPNSACNKKVTNDGGDGAWHCEKCNKSYDAPVPRYILSFTVADSTGTVWVTAFNEIAEVMLGKTAIEMKDIVDMGNEQAFVACFDAITFNMYTFKIRAKAETRDDEVRMRCSVVQAMNVDFKSECNYLLQEIAKFD